ncbi:MAG TPA: hypothetical protein VHW23_12620 [Kofleriaceae bacterium]|jgi:hypothetical protein|nr:hypothetical protein [Kofleriaceae bacterium]
MAIAIAGLSGCCAAPRGEPSFPDTPAGSAGARIGPEDPALVAFALDVEVTP